MSNVNIIQGELRVNGGRFALVASRFNSFIVDQLVKGAVDALVRHGAKDSDIDVIYVPGAFEIPLAVLAAAGQKKYAGIVALGAVIRGATPHFDYVAGECVKGMAAVMMQLNVPVGFGVLTVDTIEQAIERAGTKAGNKGVDAAMSVIEMINLLPQLKSK